MKFVASFFCVEWFAVILKKLNRILERWRCLLEEQRPIFEHLRPLLAYRLTLLENEELIRTFQIILEKAGQILENIPRQTLPNKKVPLLNGT